MRASFLYKIVTHIYSVVIFNDHKRRFDMVYAMGGTYLLLFTAGVAKACARSNKKKGKKTSGYKTIVLLNIILFVIACIVVGFFDLLLTR